jgi:N-terminal domain of cytochrome oxidase-cbb3, FixP
MSEQHDEDAEGHEIGHYDYSGIDERHGFLPKWLLGVYVILLIWMVYYLIRFWTDKG